MYKASEVHHDFIQKYRKEFERLRIDIDHPAVTRWVEQGKHREWSDRFEKMWDNLFDAAKRRGAEVSKKEVIDLFKKIRDITGKDGKGLADSAEFPSYCP